MVEDLLNKNLILDVKKKREFSELPESLIDRALNLNKKDIKLTRAFLRKYFGVFLTNKVIKLKNQEVLASHISSKKRDYNLFYQKIKDITGTNFKSILDLGCGVNGFSYPLIIDAFGEITYLGIEALGQLCENTNNFFKKNNFKLARVENLDLFNLIKLKEIFVKFNSPKLILILQIVDALESIEKNFSKKILDLVFDNMNKDDFVLLSNPKKSISGKTNFSSKRIWLKDFLSEKVSFFETFELFEEEYIIIKK